MAIIVDNTLSGWKPAETINVTEGGLASMVIYRSYVSGQPYRFPDDATHLHVSMSESSLVYSVQKSTQGSNGDVKKSVLDTSLSFVKVSYEKQMYKPGTVTIQMTMSGGDESTYAEMLRKIFLTKECTVDLVTNVSDDASADESDNAYFAIARFYYVKSVSLKYNEEGSAIATLTCYSPDNKLRKDKFCKVYTGKKFANEVFAGAVESLKTNGKNVFSKCKDPDHVTSASYYVNSNDLVFLSYKKEELVSSQQSDFVADSDSASAGDSEKQSEGTTAELLQPYLLQYNESMYDFLCRVANRCGEFMYYDNGVLSVGLPKKTHAALFGKSSEGSGKAAPNHEPRTTNHEPSLITLKPTHTSYPEMSLDDETGITTELFTENALDSDLSTSAASGHNYFNADSGDDEYLYNYKENQDDDVPSKINALDDEYIILEAFAKFASAQKKDKAILNPVLGVVSRIIKCYPILGMTFSTLSSMLSEYKNIYNALSNKDKGTALKDLYNNLCNFFYSELEELEHEADTKVIEMDFDNSLPEVFLGDAVTMEGGLDDSYIVTGVKGEYSVAGHSHIVTAVPLLKKATRTGKEQKYATASDSKMLIAVPPFAVPHIIKGKPQKAIIRDTTDPLTMGRVRITYPWQKASNFDLDNTDTDYSEGYSPWIRMSTPFAGDEANQGGIFMKPALGTHVIVNYFNDNMEDPYVEGSLYYKKNSAPGYKWEYSHKPSAVVRTIQSASGHGIRFIEGDKNSFLADHLLPVLQPLKLLLPDFPEACNTGGMVLSDQSGIYKIAMDAGSRSIKIQSPVGTVNINAFTGITISAPNGDVNIVGKNVNIKAGNNLSLQAGANVSVPGEPGTKTSKLQGAVSSISSLVSGLIVSNTVGAISIYDASLTSMLDLAYLRSSWEVLMRPVEGTLSISTSRNITMTAGKGKTTIPAYLLTQKTAGLASLTGQQLQLATKDSSPVVRVAKMLELVRDTIYEYYMRNVKQYKELDNHVSKVYDMLASNEGVNDYCLALTRSDFDYAAESDENIVEIRDRLMNDASSSVKSKQEIVDTMKSSGADEVRGLKRVTVMSLHPVYRHRANELKNEYNAALYAYRKLYTRSDDTKSGLVDAINEKLDACSSFFETTLSLDSVDMSSNFKVECIKNLESSTEMYDSSNKLIGGLEMNTENCHTATIQIFYLLIKQLGDYITFDDTLSVIDDDDPYYVATDWFSFIESIKVKPANANNTSWASVLSGVMDKLMDKAHISDDLKLLNWNGCSGVRATSDVTTGGRILVSSNKGQTLMTNAAGTAFEAKANPSDETIKAVLKNATMTPTEDAPLPDPGILWDPTKVLDRIEN